MNIEQKKAFRLFGAYFLSIFSLCVFVSATTLKSAKERLNAEKQAALLAELEAQKKPVIELTHTDLTGVKYFVNKKHERAEKRRQRELERQQQRALAAEAAQDATILVLDENDPHPSHSSYSNTFVAGDSKVQEIPVKYSSELDSAAKATLRHSLITEAKKHLGTRYVWAGAKPGGFDCSGFTSYLMGLHGVSISRSSRHQATQGKKKAMADVETGDLIFFSRYGKGGRVSHVALVVENTPEGIHVIHATSRGIVIDNIHESTYWKPKILYAKDVLSM